MMTIVLATRNRKKAEEVKRILLGTDIKILTLDYFPDCPEVDEDRNTFEGNAVKKASVISQCTGLAALADDSGLEVDALNGSPGVFSARYAGDNASDEKNIEKLLNDLSNVPDEKRTARFVCCIAIVLPDGREKTFFGYVHGTIGRTPRGHMGFGYDPIFCPDGYDLTFAEMTSSEKDLLSHRKEALEKLKKYLLTVVDNNT